MSRNEIRRKWSDMNKLLEMYKLYVEINKYVNKISTFCLSYNLNLKLQ